VLDGADLDVKAGELVAVMGRSGSGKSTLLHILGGLDSSFDGEVTVAGVRLTGLDDAALARFRNTSIGLVFQSFHLISGLDAQSNVALPAFFGARGDAKAALERVGLGAKAHRQPSQLSGGERQRVAIARALFSKPKVLFCDEPTGNLDAATGADIIALFKSLNAEGLTVLAVTHEERVSSGGRAGAEVGRRAARVTAQGERCLEKPSRSESEQRRRGFRKGGPVTPGALGPAGAAVDSARRARCPVVHLRRHIGIAALVFFVALGLGVGRVVREKVFHSTLRWSTSCRLK